MTIKEITNKDEWEDFVLSHTQQNFLQSWYWGEAQKSLDKEIFRLGICNSSLQGVCLLIKEEARRGAYFTCPAGPLLNWQDKELFPFLLKEIKKIARHEKARFMRIRPQLEDNLKNRQLFKKLGFIRAPMHLHAETTWQLDLLKNEEELLENMDKDHRYEIRKAAKRGVKVVASSSLDDIDLLYQMQLMTAKRHKFVPFGKKYLQAEFEAFLPNNNVLLLKAILESEILAMAMFVIYGQEAVYHHSATTPQARKTSAAYLILWEAILEAKRREIERFNFWGIAPESQKKHRYYKLNHFKKGFGGFQVNYLNAYDLAIDIGYWPIYFFETLRRKARRL